MNGQKYVSSCGGCGIVGTFGGRPAHAVGCSFNGRPWDVVCDCLHWGGMHTYNHVGKNSPSGYGCVIEGCKCEVYCDDFPLVKEVKKSCECGARATGIPDGSILHSHFGLSDPTRWCPVRQGAKAR